MLNEARFAAASRTFKQHRYTLFVGCLEQLNLVHHRQVKRLLGEDVFLDRHLTIDEGLDRFSLLHGQPVS
jgi:hypothetical protein